MTSVYVHDAPACDLQIACKHSCMVCQLYCELICWHTNFTLVCVLQVEPKVQKLYDYIRERGTILPINDYNQELLMQDDVHKRVAESIRSGECCTLHTISAVLLACDEGSTWYLWTHDLVFMPAYPIYAENINPPFQHHRE